MTLQDIMDNRWQTPRERQAENSAAIRTVERSRNARRDNEPLPQGGLFDEVARNQLDMFE